MLRAGELETTSLQAKCFHSRIFAGWISSPCLGSPQPPELGFSNLPKPGVEAGDVAPRWAASSKAGAAGRAPLPRLAQHLINSPQLF